MVGSNWHVFTAGNTSRAFALRMRAAATAPNQQVTVVCQLSGPAAQFYACDNVTVFVSASLGARTFDWRNLLSFRAIAAVHVNVTAPNTFSIRAGRSASFSVSLPALPLPEQGAVIVSFSAVGAVGVSLPSSRGVWLWNTTASFASQDISLAVADDAPTQTLRLVCSLSGSAASAYKCPGDITVNIFGALRSHSFRVQTVVSVFATAAPVGPKLNATIAAIAPSFCNANGGTRFSVNGTRFHSDALLFFAGTRLNATLLAAPHNNTLLAVTLATAPGHVRITVANPPAGVSRAQLVNASEPTRVQPGVFADFDTRTDLLYAVAPAALSCTRVGFWFHDSDCEACPSALGFAHLCSLLKCVPSAAGAYCPGADLIWPLPGYWAPDGAFASSLRRLLMRCHLNRVDAASRVCAARRVSRRVGESSHSSFRPAFIRCSSSLSPCRRSQDGCVR